MRALRIHRDTASIIREQTKNKVKNGTVCCIRCSDKDIRTPSSISDMVNYPGTYEFLYDGKKASADLYTMYACNGITGTIYLKDSKSIFFENLDQSKITQVYKYQSRSWASGEMCGGIHVNLFNYGGFTIRPQEPINLGNLKVHDEFKGLGYARKLFRNAIRLLRHQGVPTMCFKCTNELLGMYEKFGARCVHASEDEYTMEISTKETRCN